MFERIQRVGDSEHHGRTVFDYGFSRRCIKDSSGDKEGSSLHGGDRADLYSHGKRVFIDYQNVTAKDGSDNKSSTVVEYTTDGTVIRTFSIGGHSDGMRMNPVDHILAQLNRP